MTVDQVIKELKKSGSEYNRKGMARFGINVEKAFGVNVPVMRGLAKSIGKNHELALELWKTEIHEARHIATMIADPKLATKKLLNKWVRDFNSWDICDGACINFLRNTDYAIEMIYEWAECRAEYVRRTAFSLIAVISVHHKKRNDDEFLDFLELIKKHSVDERNMVKKAVNWALRQIGKRSFFLNKEALKTANEIKNIDSKAARWIASDAIRELTNPKILARIKR
jgi:3-methyladenine DNA glycosylase AlkD